MSVTANMTIQTRQAEDEQELILGRCRYVFLGIYFHRIFPSLALVLAVLGAVIYSGSAQADMFKLPQTVVLVHEEIVKPYPETPAGRSLTDVMVDVGATIETGVPVGYVANQNGAGDHPPCLLAQEGEEGAGKLVAKLISNVGITGFRKRGADIQFRMGFRRRPPILIENNGAPDDCETEIRRRAELDLDRIIRELAQPTTVTAAEILRHLPIGGGGEVRPLTLKKKVKFFEDETELEFRIPLGRIL